MILYAAIFKTIDTDKDLEVRQAHLDYIYDLLNKNIIVAKGPFTDHSGGLILYQADTLETATAYVNNDPVILENSRVVEIKEWKSTLEFPAL